MHRLVRILFFYSYIHIFVDDDDAMERENKNNLLASREREVWHLPFLEIDVTLHTECSRSRDSKISTPPVSERTNERTKHKNTTEYHHAISLTTYYTVQQ